MKVDPPFIVAERGYIDDVIMPHSTRRRIARALAMLRDKKVEMTMKKHNNLPLRGDDGSRVARVGAAQPAIFRDDCGSRGSVNSARRA